MPDHTSPSPSAVALHDARPFFEKALQYGVQHGLIDQARLDAICADAPKGMVQIARYFGSEFLRPELEKAKDRMVNLVSLYLEHSTGGDLRRAAESLRDHSFLSRSKGGSDMLKAMLSMPKDINFDNPSDSDANQELENWSLRNLDTYKAELTARIINKKTKDAAIWLVEYFGMDFDKLEDACKDSHINAEAVIRTALLSFALGRIEMPDWVGFEKMISALRKKYGASPTGAKTTIEDLVKPLASGRASTKLRGNLDASAFAPPSSLPLEFAAIVETVRISIVADLQKILDVSCSAIDLFDKQNKEYVAPLLGRYFWIQDSLNEVVEFDRSVSKAWNKATGGHRDEGSLLTMFLCVATESAPKTLLTERSAKTMIRKIRKTGIQSNLALQYINDHAPAEHKSAYSKLWHDFIDEARATLQSDHDYALKDALALLRHECNVK